MTDATTTIEQAEFLTDLDPQVKSQLEDLIKKFANDAIQENSNILRLVIEESADRLRNGGPRYEIAEQLQEAASASFEELCSRNIEIEVDDDLIPVKKRPEVHGDPILRSLLRAIQLRDAISALEISGDTPSPERHSEFQSALYELRDILNKNLKDQD